MFEEMPLPPDWPVYVSQAEASRTHAGKGGGFPTEAEYHRAAFGTPEGIERSYPWGEAPPSAEHGNFDFCPIRTAAGRIVPVGRERMGRARSRRKWLGMDVHDLRLSPDSRRCRRNPSTPPSFLMTSTS